MNKVQSIVKKILKAILWVALIFVCLFAIIATLIQIPSIQTKIIQTATSFVSKKTHTKVEIKNVSISFPKSVVVEGLFLEDLKKDTLIYAGKAKVNIALFELIRNKINVNFIELEHVNLNLHNTTTDSLFNYNFLLTAFNDTTNKTKVDSKAPSAWKFNIDKISLKNIRVRYDDDFGGMNVSAAFKKLEMKMDKLDLEKMIFNIDDLLVDNLTAKLILKATTNPKGKKSESILPTVTANNIQINNSTVMFGDSLGKQSALAVIKRFEIKEGTVDLQDSRVILDKVYLTESDISYKTTETKTTSDVSAETVANNWKVMISNVELDENSLTYDVIFTPTIKNAFDANHLYFRYFTLEAKDLDYSTAKTAVNILKFNAIDRNKFIITNFTTDFLMDEKSITAKNLNANTTNSSIKGTINLQFESLKSLKNDLPRLVLNVDLNRAYLKNSDILYINPSLSKLDFFKNRNTITTISGVLTGQVNNLNGRNLMVTTGEKTELTTNFNIKGLPEAQTANFDFPNLHLISGAKDMQLIAGSYLPKSFSLPGDIDMKVVFKGKMKDFATKVDLNSSFGSGHLVAKLDQAENFDADLNIPNFDLGSLMKDKTMYGPVSMTAQINGHGLSPETMKAVIKADVAKLYLNKYTYHNLNVDGSVKGREFSGKVNLNDENAKIDFDGLVNLNPGQEQYKFLLNVEGADLQKLSLTKTDTKIGLVAVADLNGGSVTKLNGNAGVSKMIIVHKGKKYVLDSLLFASINQPKKSEFSISSALVGLKYAGTISPTALSSELGKFLNKYFPFSDAKIQPNKSDSSNFKFEIQLHNHPILSQVLLPELKEFEPGIIEGSFDSQKNELKLKANMPKIVYGSTELNDLAFDVNSDSTALNYSISSSNISNSQIKFVNFLFDGKIAHQKILANISSIDGLDKKLVIRSEITKEKANYKLKLNPNDFYLVNNRWNIAADNYMEFGSNGFLIHHLFFNNSTGQINIASVHDKFNDDLNIGIKNFKLDDLSQIVEKDTSLVKGVVDGNVLLKRVNDSYGIIADAQIANLVVRNVPIGNVALKASNPTTEKFDIDLKLSGKDNNLTASGFFIPNGGDHSLNVKTVIQSLSMKTVEAFSMGQVTEASGSLSGDFAIGGSTSSPEITGQLIFNNAFMNPAFLNTRMELKHETILLKTDGFYFNNFTMLDPANHIATIDGVVNMKQFSDFNFGLNLKTTDFTLFNTTVKDNKQFFGRMVIDSKIDIKGPMSLPVINARLKMKKGSNFTFAVPEDKLTTDKGEDVVEFEDSIKLNPILDRVGKKEKLKSSFTGFDLTSIIEVDKQATLRLLMDPTSTDSLVVKGEAALSFTMDRSGKMSLTGAYNLNEGSYLVSLQSVIKKKFDIVSGSTIIWNGDPLDAKINIDATYSVRAAPFDLVATQMSGLSAVDQGGYKQRYPFLVFLKLRGDILKPVISFEIQLKPEDKGILGGAVNQKLNLLNEDASELNKQVFALLVLGRFVQENPLQTESSGTSMLIRSTVGNFLSSELNKMSSKFIPGVELNFDIQSFDDYQTGQAQGRTQVGIGVKKQLFNERLSVQLGGTVDVEGAAAKQNSASDITGDVAIEYKMTQDGSFRLKGFRHNQYEGAIDGQLIETGVGVMYVKDFNKWKNFFKVRKKAKAEAKTKEVAPKSAKGDLKTKNP